MGSLLLLALYTLSAPPSGLDAPLPDREVAVPSKFSDIRIRDEGTFRSMYFARPDGTMALETRIDKKQPARLVVPYTRAMFASYLHTPAPKRALLVGLGGGAMVHFLAKFDADLLLTAVDIDPAVVSSAAKYFGVRSTPNVEILTADAFDVLAKASPSYDVIWMDAFLQPSEDTDENGVPLTMKTLAFWRQVKSRLSVDGVLVVNVNTGASTQKDLAVLKEAVGTVFTVTPRGSGNLIVIAPKKVVDTATIEKRAKALGARDATVGFEDLAARLRPY